MGDPINPLELEPDGLEPLPAPEQLADPVPEGEQGSPAATAPAAAQNGAQAPISPDELQALAGLLGGAAARREAPGPVIGDLRQLGAIQSDAEQTLAEARSTRRAVQLLAISIAAVALLAALYAVRAARAGQVAA